MIGLLILLQKYDKILRLQNKKKGKMYCRNKKWVKVKIIDEIRKKGGNIQWNGINVSAGKLSENWNREAGEQVPLLPSVHQYL